MALDMGTYRWQEILEALGCYEREVHQAEVPSKWISGCSLDTIPRATDALVMAAVGHLNAVHGHFALFRGQPFGVVRPRRKQEVGTGGHNNRCSALDDEEPLPGVEPENLVHVCQDTGGQEARQDIRHGISRMPDSHAHGILLFGVPGRCHCYPSVSSRSSNVGLMHGNILSVIPGKKGASDKPMKKRHTAKPAPLVIAGMQIVAILQAIIMDGKSHLGSAFASHRLPGSWPTR